MELNCCLEGGVKSVGLCPPKKGKADLVKSCQLDL